MSRSPFVSHRLRATAQRTWPVAWLALWALFFSLVVWVQPAGARDCPPDDPSRSDCKAAATTARNPLVPVAGAGAGAVAGAAATAIGSRRRPGETVDETPEEVDCNDLMTRFRIAQNTWKMRDEALKEALAAAKVPDYAAMKTRLESVAQVVQRGREDLARGEAEWAAEVANLESLHWQLAGIASLGAVVYWVMGATAMGAAFINGLRKRMLGLALGTAMYVQLARVYAWEAIMGIGSLLSITSAEQARLQPLLNVLGNLLNTARTHLTSILGMASTWAAATFTSIQNAVTSPMETYYSILESVISVHREALNSQTRIQEQLESRLRALRELEKDLRKKDLEEREARREALDLKSSLLGPPCEKAYLAREEPFG